MAKSLQRFFRTVWSKVLIVVLYSIVVVLVFWYTNADDIPVKSRCSAEYQELAEVLQQNYSLVNGSVKAEDGRVFPPGTFWEQDNVMRVCPCSIGVCVRKCCPSGKSFNKRFHCEDTASEVLSSAKMHVCGKVPRDFYGEADRCTASSLSVKNFSNFPRRCSKGAKYKEENVYLLENGKMWDEHNKLFRDQSQYCLEEVHEGSSVKVAFETCPPSDKKVKLYYLGTSVWDVVFIVTMVLQFVAILKFALTPQLRSGYRASILNYLVTNFIRSILLFVISFDYIRSDEPLCYIYAPFLQYSWLSVRAWLFIIAYQIRRAFQPGQLMLEDSDQCNINHSAVAWGLPFLHTAASVVIDLSPGVPDILKPKFGKPWCWYNSTSALVIHSVLPSFVIEVAIFAMCADNLRRLRAFHATSLALRNRQSSDVDRKVEWCNVYMRLFILMGFNYLLVDMVLYYHRMFGAPVFLWKSAMALGGTRGCELLFVFGEKQDDNKSRSSSRRD